MQAYDTKTGEPVAEGDMVTSFRGDTAFFIGITREPQGNSTGRVAAICPGKNWPKDQEATQAALMEDYRTHPWDERSSDYREVFPGVFGLEIR
jgi:hypothetical protein